MKCFKHLIKTLIHSKLCLFVYIVTYEYNMTSTNLHIEWTFKVLLATL